MRIEEIKTPAVVIDWNRLVQNINRMAQKAKEFGVSLRPHIKTHKCIEIAELQKKAGAQGITVSTVFEALTFAKHGFKNITLAIPIAHDKFDIIREIIPDVSLKVIVDHPRTVEALSEFCQKEGITLDVLLKVDCDYHRCGVDPRKQAAVRLAEQIHLAGGLDFRGILTHGGHVYSAHSVTEIRRTAHQIQKTMVEFAKTLKQHNPQLEPEVISVGSTPAMSIGDEIVSGVTEIRPGNYVFYDYYQVVLGSCAANDCALTVLASIIGVYKDRLIIDAGATALSVDPGPVHLRPECGYGQVLTLEQEPFPNLKLVGLSQEHGKIRFENMVDSKQFELGTKIRVLPNHACLTVNLFDCFYVVDQKRLVNVWPIHRGHVSKRMCNSMSSTG